MYCHCFGPVLVLLGLKGRCHSYFYRFDAGGGGGGGGTPINRVYGDDPLNRVSFLDFFVIDRVSILRFVSSRFDFLVIDRVLLLLTGLECNQHWSLFHRLINETLNKNVPSAFAAFLKSSLSGPKIKTMKQGRAILRSSYTRV